MALLDYFHTFTPPSIISIGPLIVHSYGLLLGLGLISAFFVVAWIVRSEQPYSDQPSHWFAHFEKILPLLVVAGVMGGRALFVLYHLPYFMGNPYEIVAIWHGGWVWHGALIAGGLALSLYCRVYRISFLAAADLLAPGMAVGQAIGRWGNYFNQEAYGLPTDALWGIPIDAEYRLSGFEYATHFHPTFLYEFALDLGIFLTLLWLMKRRVLRYASGQVILLYLVLYSLGRIAIELLRIDIVPIFWGLRAPIWCSILILFVSLGLGVFLLQKRKHRDILG